MADKEHRIVITGIGAIFAGSAGKEETWNACLNGVSMIGEIEAFDTSSFPIALGGEVADEILRQRLSEEWLDKVDRFSALAMIASQEALEDSGLDPARDGERIGAYFGSCFSGRTSLEKQKRNLYRGGAKRVHPRHMQNIITNAASGETAIYLGLMGPNLAYSVGSGSGAYALIQAYNTLKRRPVGALLVGGAEAPIVPSVLEELNDTAEISGSRDDPKDVVRPFDKKRGGFVASEGSCVLVLERLEDALSRKAHIYAEITGYGLHFNRYRDSAEDRRVDAMETCIKSALEDASLPPGRVDYVSANGLSTATDDLLETQAIKSAFGDHAERIAMSSVKPVTGYAFAASEILETAICALSIQEGRIPPTINLDDPDEDCDLDYVPNRAREMPVRAAMSNSFGTDGNYSSIVVEKVEG